MKNPNGPPHSAPSLILPLLGIAVVSLLVGGIIVTRDLDRAPAKRGLDDLPDSTFATQPMEVLANGGIALDWERVPGADSYVLQYLAGDLSLVATAWISPDLTTELPYVSPTNRDPIQYWRMIAYRADEPVAVSRMREYPGRVVGVGGGLDDGR